MTPRRVVVSLAAFLVVVIALNAGLDRVRAEWDLTAEGSATLSDQTRRVLDDVDKRIAITAFFPRDALGRVEAATLLQRYRDENRLITFKIVDPDLAPAEAQRLGIEQTGSAAVVDVSDPDNVEVAQYAIEIDITSAIARLLRNVQGTICFTSGSGEREMDDASPTGLAEASNALRANGYEVRTLRISERTQPDCDAIVVANPKSVRKELSAVIEEAVTTRGKVMLLADPASDAKLDVPEMGIEFDHGTVVEGDPDGHLPDDLTAPVISRYAGGSPVVRGLGPTFFPRTMAVDAKETDDRGLIVTEIATTSELGYLDRDDLGEFDPKVDRPGPVSIGVAADSSEVEDATTESARIERTRVLAWGDVDFATNAFINDGSNAQLWLQGIDWLTQPEDLVTAVPNFPQVRELELTEARSRYILFLMAGVVPALFLIAGALVWVLRRSR